MTIKAGIFILTQNTTERKTYLKTSLYFLFRHFNSKFKYPVIILHEKDYDEKSKQEIIQSVRESCRSLISFKEIDENDFVVPSHINMEKLKEIVAIQPVPYWRSIRYRQMCYFWVKHFIKYTEGFDYVMRLDDDSLIEENIQKDIFETMVNKNLVYVSNILHVDCGLCNYGMKDMFKQLFPDKLETIDKGFFVDSKLSDNNEVFSKFKKVYEIVNDKSYTQTEFKTEMPLMYYNNFFATSTEFWKQENVKELINKIDENGGIFYYRYGDAPIQTLLVTLLSPDKISRVVFKYSKRLQREVFIDSENQFHSYMPKTYDQSSCILQK